MVAATAASSKALFMGTSVSCPASHTGSVLAPITEPRAGHRYQPYAQIRDLGEPGTPLFALLYGHMRVLFTLCLAAAAVYAQKAPGFDPGALNRNVDPCANFYQYACGGWMAGNPLPGDASRWGRFDSL